MRIIHSEKLIESFYIKSPKRETTHAQNNTSLVYGSEGLEDAPDLEKNDTDKGTRGMETDKEYTDFVEKLAECYRLNKDRNSTFLRTNSLVPTIGISFCLRGLKTT